MSCYSFTLCFLAAIVVSQLSAAPTPAPYDEIVVQGQTTMYDLSAQGQQYGNYAMNEASANGQYAVDQMKSNGQQAMDAGKNLVSKTQNSIGNISLNPLSYMPTWMQPDPQNLSRLAQTTSDYASYYANKGSELLHEAGAKGKEMIQSGIENGQYLIGKAKEKGQEISQSISNMADSGIGHGKDFTKGGIQQGAQSVQSMGNYEKSFLGSLGDKLDSFNGYIAEKLYKTADGVGNLSIPKLDQQLSYSYY